MKRLFAILALSCITFASQAQKKSMVQPISSIPAQKMYNLDTKPATKTSDDCLKNAQATNSQATYKETTYKVYITKNSKLFIIVQNKENAGYHRKYISES